MTQQVLVTGGAGYIGCVLVEELLSHGYSVTVLDRFFFGHKPLAGATANPAFKLVKDDIRFFKENTLAGIDIVLDLAGISNDPSCELDPAVTLDVNQRGSIRVATLAKAEGVKRYILCSSCSIYGHGAEQKLTEDGHKNPVSLYAKSKLAAEEGIAPLADKNFCVTFLRNGTVYGLSQRMRFDLVINLMTMRAWKYRKIYIMGGGQQWRPVVHVRDVAAAFLLAMKADPQIVNGQAFNVGSNQQNYRVWQLASLVRDVVPNVDVEIVPDDADRRDYNVCFDKIATVLGYEPRHTVREGVKEIQDALESGSVDPEDPTTVTVKYYKYLLSAEELLQTVSYNGRIF